MGDRFERISWKQALDEIAAKLKEIVRQHGPRSVAYMGGGGQGCHFEAAFGSAFSMGWGPKIIIAPWPRNSPATSGSRARPSAVSTCTPFRTSGNRISWSSGGQSHGKPRYPPGPGGSSKQEERAGIQAGRGGPPVSETAKLADIHLRLKPGTDALLMKAMIKILLSEEGLLDKEYLAGKVNGFGEIKKWFDDVNIEEKLPGLRPGPRSSPGIHPPLCHPEELLAQRPRHSHGPPQHPELLPGIDPPGPGRPHRGEGRERVRRAPHAHGSHTPEEDPGTWRTVATNIPLIMGVFPPNVMPEEIENGHPSGFGRSSSAVRTPCAPMPTPLPTKGPLANLICWSLSKWP